MFFGVTMKNRDEKHLSGGGSFTEDKKYKIFNDSTNLHYNKTDDSAASDICNKQVQSTTDNVKKGGIKMLFARIQDYREIHIIFLYNVIYCFFSFMKLLETF